VLIGRPIFRPDGVLQAVTSSNRAEPEHPDHVERQIHSVKWGC
jgi:hypothetical protein